MSTAARILTAIRLHARRHALWMEQKFAHGRTSPDQGLAITAGEVSWILAEPLAAAAAFQDFLADPEIAALAGPIREAELALAADPVWHQLTTHFALSPAEQKLLALASAEALDPDFGRVIAYLNDDARQTKATPWLAARLADNPEPAAGLDSLRNWRLAVALEGHTPGLPATPYQLDAAVLSCILTGEWADPALDRIASLPDPGPEAAMPVIHPAALAAMTEPGRKPAFDLAGGEGSGRRVLATQFASATGRRLALVDAAALAAAPAPPDLAIACLRMARATGAILLIRHAESMPKLPVHLSEGVDIIRAVAPDAVTRPDALVLRLPPPDAAARTAIWRHHARTTPPPLIVTTQRLSPSEIALVAAAPTGVEAVRAALRRSAPPEGGVLSLLPCPYDWEDLILPPELRGQLQEFAAQIRLRWEVYEEWGFGRLAHLGAGIAALFAGPSGTGKTMAAQVLARALELDLYRVDLAGVVNKYIGETEKRLRDVFAFGERAGAMLFFDEADALFGSRTEVKDSHDRFANIEIDYLLQRIERFDGIAILATNRKSDLDTAFLRRLRFVVDFVPPGPAERLAIWRLALPTATPAGEPLAEAIDWHMLADRITLTGADIKAAALSAAFLARAEGNRIAMRHVLAAVQRELGKRGQTMRLRPAEVTST